LSFPTNDAPQLSSHHTVAVQPVTLYTATGSPFQEFSALELVKQTDFGQKIGNRSVKYFGDYEYRYGKVVHKACKIPNSCYLRTIVNKFSQLYPHIKFNSVLLTKYDNGQSTIPMHSDNEEMIETGSEILTISLGASRDVRFQPKSDKNGFSVSVKAGHGSVYSMSHKSQQLYMHGVPRDNTCSGMRVSITFRQLISAREPGMVLQSTRSNDNCVTSTPLHQNSETEKTHTFDSFPDSLTNLAADVSTVQPPLPTNLKPDTTEKLVDTLYISSSMFRNLDASKLSTDSHRASVCYFPGATAAGILKITQNYINGFSLTIWLDAHRNELSSVAECRAQ
jgi:alkylated DNA repair dioxygenase AlkB